MKKNFFEIRWIQETLILVASFILVTLNSWTRVSSLENVLQAVTYFTILYTHAQLHRFVLLPGLFNKNRYFFYVFYTILLIFIFSAVLFITDVYWIYPKYGTENYQVFEIYLYHIGTCTLSLVAILGLFLLLQFYVEQKKKASVQLSINQTELKILHSQLNPHFLFNTFNNLYGISLNDPERVPDFILQVSKLMRYHLESNARKWATLEEELAFVESYIALEEERVGRRCDIKYKFTNNSNETLYLITPLLLISFIENAFKHGTNTIEDCFVHVNIIIKNGNLEMDVINSVPKITTSFKSSTGIGLNNAKQRLNILYDGRYKLVMKPETEKYTVQLMLPLTRKKYAEQNQMSYS